MANFLFGVAVGAFMAAFVNHKYNSSKWISTKYLVWTGIIALILSTVVGWSDIKNTYLEGVEAGRALGVLL